MCDDGCCYQCVLACGSAVCSGPVTLASVTVGDLRLVLASGQDVVLLFVVLLLLLLCVVGRSWLANVVIQLPCFCGNLPLKGHSVVLSVCKHCPGPLVCTVE